MLPSFRIKALFWLLLAVLSVILAEVVCYSSPFPFFDGWGLTVVLPLYGLHSIVLAYLIFRRRQISLSILFLAGIVFGMYEAYITKVMWMPTWGEPGMTAGGLHLLQTSILALFWHPWMAFILPLAAAESLFTTSTETLDAFPAWFQRLRRRPRGPWLVAGVFGILAGVYEGCNSPSTGLSLLSWAGAAVVFVVLALVWRRVTRDHAYSLRDLLPSDRQAAVLITLLLGFYLVSGLWLRTEALPRTLLPHLTVWAIYGILFGLLALHFRKAPAPAAEFERSAGHFGWRAVLWFWLAFLASAILFVNVKPAAQVGVFLSWVFGVTLGAFLLLRAAVQAFQPHGVNTQPNSTVR